jgi:hypothetical protein
VIASPNGNEHDDCNNINNCRNYYGALTKPRRNTRVQGA